MYRRVIAFDYDGTLAEDGKVPAALWHALERLAINGYALFLVTGRLYQTVDLGDAASLFTGIVWEDGAVLNLIQSGELYLPFGHIDPQLAASIEQAGVPLERGLAIVSTWRPHEESVTRVIGESSREAVVAHNKGAIMVLPPGATKGAGLERMLEMCGLSPRNLISFGDGENDLTLLQLGEGGVAVADAVQSLQEMADWVTRAPGPAGVLEALQTYWLNNRLADFPRKYDRRISLGRNTQEELVSLSSGNLASHNLGIFGDTGTGKSWLTGLLVEGMHQAGYQVLLIDPEGDHRGLESLSRVIALDGDEATLPSPAVVELLLEKTRNSVVLDLCNYPVDKRPQYIAGLFRLLGPLKRQKFRPHWIVLEEAQASLTSLDESTAAAFFPMLREGGWALVTYRPDQLAEEVRATLQICMITPVREPEVAETLIHSAHRMPSIETLADTRVGSFWLCDQEEFVQLDAVNRRVPHIRHKHKYVDSPLPRHKRFYFRNKEGYLGLEAASLLDFKERIATLPLSSIVYHQARGDFARWIREALGDATLAAQITKLTHREKLDGESLRHALAARVTNRYLEIYSE